jgi:phthalate 4,5-dioxygenase reductase component
MVLDGDGLFELKVLAKTQLAKDVFRFDFASVDALPLPKFTAGAHVAVKTPSGMMRHYSLCSSPFEAHWSIAVKREGGGRGGSLSLVDGVSSGQILLVGPPANNFSIPESAPSVILIAGGIGVTPLMSMVHELLARLVSIAIKFVFLTRDAQSSPFSQTLRELLPGASFVLHHDYGKPDQQFDLWPLLEKVSRAHVFCCGPAPLMDSVRDMTGHWPSSQIHFESFGVNASIRSTDEAFTVTVNSTGAQYLVEPGETILSVLQNNGVKVASSCESGTCGTCKVSLIEGTADHRDMVLSNDEKANFLMICVSRAKSKTLTIEI